MQIGIGIPNQVSDVDGALLPERARRAEEAGFSTLSTVGRIAFPGVMDTVALAVAVGVTSRINLDCYIAGGEQVVGLATSGLATTPQAIRDAIKSYEDIGADQYILMPGAADLAEIDRLAEIAL